jgi:hypothetical protein
MRNTLLTATAVAALSIAAAAMLQPGSAQAAGRPSCAKVGHTVGNITQSVTVSSICPHTISFEVHRALGPDLPCMHVPNHRSVSVKWGRWQAYQGTSFGCD